MCLQNKLHFKNIKIQSVNAKWIPENTVLDVLRLDEIHPVVSGNKWFKLKYYLEDAKQKGYNSIETFGGPYSNHIIATAFACREYGFKSIGIIRGQRPAKLYPTLINAEEYGMQLQFISRADYKNREKISQVDGLYRIEEGGYGSLGAKGAGEILAFVPGMESYTHIVCALGTGTMFAGLINASTVNQTVTGISVLNDNFSITNEVEKLVDKTHSHGDYTIIHGYHFGGYAKHPPQLINFMTMAWNKYNVPTDIVYTAKTLYALQQMALNGHFAAGSKILMVHSGGLQGNVSLPAGVLPF
jgi:1-aminocyclopropane-1-carboxylate deaminase